MKVKIHKERKLVALYSRSMETWSFYTITNEGKISKGNAVPVALNPIFAQAVTKVRSTGYKIPASGWESDNINTKGLSTMNEGAEFAWRQSQEYK